MRFDTSILQLPEIFFKRVAPVPVRDPYLIRLNRPLAAELGLDLPEDQEKLAGLFSGNTHWSGSDPVALAYAGHQFGHFVPELGDGRAVLLGEVVTDQGERFDIQLKGAGQTPFSRNGDGRSPLGPVIREYVVSEAMHALGVPTTRALAMVGSGEEVIRETIQPGALFTRVAASHLRVGTFEYCASRGDSESVRRLADYVIDRHYPEVRTAANPYAALFEAVCHAQARLVARWMSVGFIHGVMNTDNTTLSGETIDFGPCAFMDAYDPTAVFSSIDHQGRYAYNNQPTIAQWNMACLGGCLLPLLHEKTDMAHAEGERILGTFAPLFKDAYEDGMCAKIGVDALDEKDFDMVRSLLRLMHADGVDFTLAFHRLTNDVQAFVQLFASGQAVESWLAVRESRLAEHTLSSDRSLAMMRQANPVFIPRNHRVEEAIRAAEDHDDFSFTHRLIEIVSHPYGSQSEHAEYMDPPRPEERVRQTFCGT